MRYVSSDGWADNGAGRRRRAAYQELLAQTLRLVGFDVVVAECGIEAVEAARAAEPALVLLDVMLPDLDGFETARRLRAAGGDVRIIFLTARDAVEDRIAGSTAGGDNYVAKPFSLEELVLRIRAVLRRVGYCLRTAP